MNDELEKGLRRQLIILLTVGALVVCAIFAGAGWLQHRINEKRTASTVQNEGR